MSLKQQIQAQLAEVLQQLHIDSKPMLEYPADPKFGDYSTNVALVAAKQVGKNPREVAEEISSQFADKESQLIDKVEIAGPGFINFWVKPEALLTAIQSTADKKQGKEIPVLSDSGAGKKVVVEYSSPNIAKPFTIGHLRSTIIGNAIANLLEATGWEVFRDNHVGDWGTQFGKQIYALVHLGEGSLDKNLEKIEKSDRPVEELVKLYVEFHDLAEKQPEIEDEARAWFKKLEDGDPEARRLWKKCIEWSWKEFEAIYENLGVRFTENNGRGYGESFFEDKMAAVVAELKEKNLLQKGEEGAELVFFLHDALPPLMILKKDGSTLYSTRDLATDKFRLEHYGKDVVIINEVGAEQSLYFRQLYMLEEMLGWFTRGQRVHVRHGLFRFKEGKMSTRKGNVIWLEDVLEEAEKRAFHLSKEGFEFDKNVVLSASAKHPAAAEHIKGYAGSINTSRIVGIGAINWNDLKRSPEQDIVFDWDDILNMQGNSGPYMQYTYVRTQSVLKKAGERGKWNLQKIKTEERELLRLLAQFAEVVEEAANRYAPNMLCTYLFTLAQQFNLFYQKHQILKEEQAVRDFRLFLTSATGDVLQTGLTLLGIQTPEKM